MSAKRNPFLFGASPRDPHDPYAQNPALLLKIEPENLQALIGQRAKRYVGALNAGRQPVPSRVLTTSDVRNAEHTLYDSLQRLAFHVMQRQTDERSDS